MKQVQISEELFTRLCAYHLFDRREPLQEQIIKDQVLGKIEQDTGSDRLYPPEENRAMNSPAGAFNQQEILHFIYQVKQDRRKKQ